MSEFYTTVLEVLKQDHWNNTAPHSQWKIGCAF